MGETTTVRVATSTREHLNRISAASGETVDATIQRGLRLIEREQWRKQAEIDARAAAADADDRAEVAAAIRDLTGE
jgi:predicted transcriptional regulator